MDALIVAVTNQTGNYWRYVAIGYATAVVAVGGLAVQTIRRGRRLSRVVPPEKRRWL